MLPIAVPLCGILGLMLLMAGAAGYWRSAQHTSAVEELNRRLAAVSPDGHRGTTIAALKEIIAAGEGLGLNLPQARYARLWHRWRLAVDDFKQISAALNNRYLAASQRQELKAFHTRLLALREACAAPPKSGPQAPAPLAWKLHTLKGNLSVMLAYSVLTFEQDGHKAAKLLSDAVDDYKTAIAIVDGIGSAPLERSLPRWNMELIVGLGEYRRVGLSEVRQEQMAEVRHQLEAVIPDVAGFAPGVPLDTRMEK